MQKFKVEKRGCWGMVDGIFKEMPIGHEFVAETLPPAFAGRVIPVGNAGERVFEVSTPAEDVSAEAEAEAEAEAKVDTGTSRRNRNSRES